MTRSRSEYVGSSDAKRILDGDWLALYQEKIGERPPEDLSANFPVQLGVQTEAFHIYWLNKFCGFDIGRSQHQFTMKKHEMILATVDGYCNTNRCFVEVKHSSSRASQGSMVEWYQPQIAHICNATDSEEVIVSFIAGNEAPQWFRMEPSTQYREALLEMELAFWWHIENREPPQVIPQQRLEQARAAKVEVKLDGMRTVDMTTSNAWASLATDYLLNEGASKLFEKSKKELKALVEPDVREAAGWGVTIKRNKAGSLLFSGGSD